MIRYSEQEGFIRPKGIRFKDGQDENVVLPEVAVGVFSNHLYYDVIQKFNCREVGVLRCANMEREVYILSYKGVDITFFMAGVSGPWISSDIEELSAQGVKKFIIFGNCGVLDSKIEDCSIIVPTKAFREDGISYHYVPESDMIDIDLKYKESFIEILNKFNFEYTEGYTWTTDAFFRETPEKIAYFKEKGAVCVEMEASAIAATCKYLGCDYFTFYYAGDNLDSTEWDERSLSGLVNIDKKKEVMLLALELAIKIND